MQRTSSCLQQATSVFPLWRSHDANRNQNKGRVKLRAAPTIRVAALQQELEIAYSRGCHPTNPEAQRAKVKGGSWPAGD